MTRIILTAVCMALCAQAGDFRALVERSPRLQLKKSELPVANAGFPSAVAMGKDGTIYVLHRGDAIDPIVAVDQLGRVVRSWGKGMFKIPHSIRVDASGNVWTVDAASSVIRKFTPRGRTLLVISLGGQPSIASEFKGTTDIAFGPDGQFFVSDGYGNARILEYSPEGKLVRQWGRAGEGPGEFKLPHGIAVMDGVIYVADRENGRVQRFDSNGRFLDMWENLGKVFSVVAGKGEVWIGTQERDEPNGSPGWMVKLDPKTGKILGYIDSFSGQHILNLTPDGELLGGARPDTVLWFKKAR